jgi:MFS family permease
MTEDMRKVAVARIIADRVSVAEAKSGVWHGLKLALCDYKLYLMIMCNVFISMAYGLYVNQSPHSHADSDKPSSNFYPSIVRGFGYSRTITLVMTFPPWFLAAIGSVVLGRSSDKRGERSVHFSVPIAIAMAAYVVCMITVNYKARYAASFFFISCFFSANPIQHTWITGTFGRTPEKRAASLALNIIIGQSGNVIAPYFFDDDDEPRYRLAFILMFLTAGLTICTAMLLKWLLTRENKKLKAVAIRDGTAYQPYVT